MADLKPAAVALGIVTLALLACNVPLPGYDRADQDATPVPQLQATPTPGPPTMTPRPTLSPIGQRPNATPPPGGTQAASSCTLDGDFVSDVTIPDDTELEPGTSFEKTWRVENSATCDWGPGTRLVFESGDQMNGPESVPVGALAVGSEVDVSVTLQAPMEPGTYRGNWELETVDGTRFGPRLYVRIIVPES
jgi:hypothetical protein